LLDLTIDVEDSPEELFKGERYGKEGVDDYPAVFENEIAFNGMPDRSGKTMLPGYLRY